MGRALSLSTAPGKKNQLLRLWHLHQILNQSAEGSWWQHSHSVGILWNWWAKTSCHQFLYNPHLLSSIRGSPCSTHRTAAKKVTRVIFISTGCSALEWADVCRTGYMPFVGQVIYPLYDSSFMGSGWCAGGHELNPGVCYVHVGVHHCSTWNRLASQGKVLLATHGLLFRSYEWWEMRTCSLLLGISSFPSS